MSEQAALEDRFTEYGLGSPAFREVNRLYQEHGESAAHTFCIMHQAIASVCMSCRRLFRIVDSQGSSGGLSHGWCSARCVRSGAIRAKTE